MLGRALKRVVGQLPDGGGPGRPALADQQAAVLGVTGTVVAPWGKGDGVTLVERDRNYTVKAVAGRS